MHTHANDTHAHTHTHTHANDTHAHTCWQGHEDIIFCLDWDPVTRSAFSGGRESNMLVWDQAGSQKQT